ncbi:MAG: BlaI/MecI/CopY family transcriptional regulator [Butyricicoccus sp.]
MQKIKRLPDAELVVMQVVWRAPETPVLSTWITAQLKEQWKQTSVLTFLSRLCEKEFLKCEKLGKVNVYTPLIDENCYRSQESVSFLQRFYHGSVRNLVAALMGTGDLNQEDLEELRDFLEKQGRE